MLGAIAARVPTGVFTQAHVKHPVQPVLDARVVADRLAERGSGRRQTG